MATFTAIQNKKQAPSTMLNVLNYVAQEKKTRWGDALLVTGHNCVPQSSFIEMQTTKNRFHKPGGRLFYHYFRYGFRISGDGLRLLNDVRWVTLEYPDQMSHGLGSQFLAAVNLHQRVGGEVSPQISEGLALTGKGEI